MFVSQKAAYRYAALRLLATRVGAKARGQRLAKHTRLFVLSSTFQETRQANCRFRYVGCLHYYPPLPNLGFSRFTQGLMPSPDDNAQRCLPGTYALRFVVVRFGHRVPCLCES